jgi:DNA-binding transcriptional ArsR family regulator
MNKTRHRQFKDELFTQLARVSRALASRRRLEIVDLLAQGERTVEELASLVEMSVANTSLHLKALREASLVEVRRQGPYAFYRLAAPQVFRVWQAIRDLGESRFAEIDRLVHSFLEDRARFEPVGPGELLKRMRGGDVQVLDVRPVREFESGHIAGARSIPHDEVERRLREIARRREVIAYCRGPFCVYADEAVHKLRRLGYRARRLAVGYPDWQLAGLPIEKGRRNS